MPCRAGPSGPPASRDSSSSSSCRISATSSSSCAPAATAACTSPSAALACAHTHGPSVASRSPPSGQQIPGPSSGAPAVRPQPAAASAGAAHLDGGEHLLPRAQQRILQRRKLVAVEVRQASRLARLELPERGQQLSGLRARGLGAREGLGAAASGAYAVRSDATSLLCACLPAGWAEAAAREWAQASPAPSPSPGPPAAPLAPCQGGRRTPGAPAPRPAGRRRRRRWRPSG
jgi:hypothetical protein